jgi:glycine/D-amino acid oxidase-like deaminating enzyme
VGGGIVGCSLAYFAAREGLEVVVLDRADLGAHASGANAGNIHRQILTAGLVQWRGWDWIERASASVPYYMSAGDLWRELAAELGDLEVTFPGGLMVAETDEDLRVIERKTVLERAQGCTTELVGRDDLHRLAPCLGDGFIGGSFCAEEGRVNPLTTLPLLVARAEHYGARFMTWTKVLAIENNSLGTCLRTDAGSVLCRRLVNAAGAEARAIARLADFDFALNIRPIQVIGTEPVGPLLPRIFYHARVRLTMKQVSNGNVIIGGGWPGSLDSLGRPIVRRESIAGSAWVAAHVVPAIGRLRMLRSWASVIATPDDGLPILGQVEGWPGHYMAVPNSYGFTLGPLMGLLLAEMLSRRQPSMDVAPLSPGRASLHPAS